MPDPKPIKAYTRNASGQLLPLAAETVYFEFPSGDSLEISWDEPHRDDPRPHCVQLWGGLRMAQSLPEDDIETRARIRPVAILPSAANLVLVYPYPVPPHGEHDERAPCGEDQAGPDPTVGST